MYTRATHLVFVRGTDPLLGGSDRLVTRRGTLPKSVHQAMVRQDQVGAVTDTETLLDTSTSAFPQGFDLADQDLWIDDHPLPQYAVRGLAKNATGQQPHD